MKINHRLINCYYLILLIIIGWQASLTTFKLGQTLYYQHQIVSINDQQQALIAEQNQLDKELSNYLSLTNQQPTVPADYLAINQPLVIKASQLVASK